MEIILFILPFLLAASHYVGQAWEPEESRYMRVRSLAAGIAVAYVFLALIPEILDSGVIPLRRATALMLIGFIGFHLPLRFVSSFSDVNLSKLSSDRIHSGVLTVFGFITSYVLIEISRIDLTEGLVLLFPLVTHSLLAEVVTDHFRERSRLESRLWNFAIVIAPIVGGFAALMNALNRVDVFTVMALSAGSIIYVAIREEVPSGKGGRPFSFIAGVAVVGIWIMLLRSL